MKSDSIPGLGSPEGLDQARRQFHQAALDVVAEHQAAGRPFALFLRTFAVGFFEASGYQRLLENRLQRSLFARGELNFVTVQMREQSLDYESTTLARDPRRRWLPSLVVDDQRWLEAVKYLIQRAELIVSEVVALRPGVMTELDACEQARRQDRTVVVLPPPEGVLAVDQDPIDARFPRTIHSDELDDRDPLLTFVFRDLVARLQKIDRVAAAKRLELLRRGTLDARFPITHAGVELGYAKLAVRHSKSGAWTAAALAHAKAGQIAGLIGRPATRHLSDSAILRARMLVAQKRSRAARNLLRARIKSARGARDRGAEASLLVALAELGGMARREAKHACRRAIKLSRATRDSVTETKALNRLGMIYFQADDVAAAAKAVEQALRRLPRRGAVDPHLQWSVLMNVGTLRIEQGRRQAARPVFRRAFAVARRSGNREQLEKAADGLEYLGVPVELPEEETQVTAGPQGPTIVWFTPPSGPGSAPPSAHSPHPALAAASAASSDSTAAATRTESSGLSAGPPP